MYVREKHGSPDHFSGLRFTLTFYDTKANKLVELI
jgi:hypothetical protein